MGEEQIENRRDNSEISKDRQNALHYDTDLSNPHNGQLIQPAPHYEPGPSNQGLEIKPLSELEKPAQDLANSASAYYKAIDTRYAPGSPSNMDYWHPIQENANKAAAKEGADLAQAADIYWNGLGPFGKLALAGPFAVYEAMDGVAYLWNKGTALLSSPGVSRENSAYDDSWTTGKTNYEKFQATLAGVPSGKLGATLGRANEILAASGLKIVEHGSSVCLNRTSGEDTGLSCGTEFHIDK